MACADVCFNMIAFQDEMKAKKKRPRHSRTRQRYKKWREKHEKELASSSPSERPTVPDSFLKELGEKMWESMEKEAIWEWWQRKISAGGARGPRAGESSQNQHVHISDRLEQP